MKTNAIFQYKNNTSNLCNNKQRAFTLLELVIVSGIMILIAGISMTSLKGLLSEQRVEKDAESAYAYLQRARNQTLVGENGDQYGVAFASTSITLFRGKTYVPGDPNLVTFTFLNNSVFQNVSLTGGVSQVYFSKISGKPSATGTIEVVSKSDTSINEVITIHASGLTEVQ